MNEEDNMDRVGGIGAELLSARRELQLRERANAGGKAYLLKR